MDLLGVAGHGASLTASISRGRHAGTRRHMQYGSSGVRAVTAQPSFFKDSGLSAISASLWPTESGQIFRVGGFAECAEQNRPDPSQAGAVDISRTQKWVREPTDDFFSLATSKRDISRLPVACVLELGGLLLVGTCSLRL